MHTVEASMVAATPIIEIYSPATGKLEDKIPATPARDLPVILERSRTAQAQWAKISLRERSTYLKRFIDVLFQETEQVSEQIYHHNGKLAEEALVVEIIPTLATFDYFAHKAEKLISPQSIHLKANPVAKSTLHFEPLGVIGIISPWNYPFMLTVIDLPAALMAGNSAVIKMSEHSAGLGPLIERLLRKAGFPPDLVQIIHGYGDLGAALIESGIDKVVFTGSTKTGKLVYQAAAQAMIPCALEMGGKDAALVLEDADRAKTIRGLLWGAFTNCGQACASVERAYVPRTHLAEFETALRETFDRLDASNFGFMNTLFQKEKVEQQLKDAVQKGVRVITEKKLKNDAQPFRANIAVVSDPERTTDLYREETFGPILPLIPYDTVEEAITEINKSPYGLTASIWTKNYARGESLALQIDAGAVTINDHMVTAGIPESPWNGHKLSGLGYSRSAASIKSFCKQKFVYHDRGFIKYKFWQYPWTKEKAAWCKRYLASQFSPSAWEKIVNTLRTLPRLLFRRDEI